MQSPVDPRSRASELGCSVRDVLTCASRTVQQEVLCYKAIKEAELHVTLQVKHEVLSLLQLSADYLVTCKRKLMKLRSDASELQIYVELPRDSWTTEALQHLQKILQAQTV